MKNYKLSGVSPIIELGKSGQTLTGGGDRITVSSNVYVPNGRLITEADLNAKEGDAGIFETVRIALDTNATPAGLVAGASYGGVTLVANDRVLLLNQNSSLQNGIYVIQAGVDPVRATDANTSEEFIHFKLVSASEGTNAGTAYYYSGVSKPTIDSTAITFDVAVAGGVGDGAITAIKISDDAITAAKIANNAITLDAMADDSVGADEIVAGSIVAAHLSTALNAEIDGKVDIVNLASVTSGKGASTVGIQDAGEKYAADNVEDALAEVMSYSVTNRTAVGDGNFTEENYVNDGDDASESLDNLDIQAKVNADLTSDNNVAIGTRQYTNDNYMVDGESITASLDRVDIQLAANVANDALKVEKTKLAGTTSAADEGAKIVGIYDADGRFTSTTVEGALSEVKALADSTALGVGAFWAAADLHALESEGNITLSGEQTIDGVLTSNSRVLVAHNTDASENGIYDTGAGAWTRATDAASSADFTTNKTISIDGGVNHAGAIEAYSGTSSPTIGTSDITFEHKSSSNLGDGSVTSAKLAASSVTNVKIAADAIDGTKLADNSVDTEHLVNGSVTDEKITGPISANKVQGLNADLYTKIDTKVAFFSYGDTGTFNIDTALPSGSYINNVKLFTEVAFNGTTPTLTIGKAGATAEVMTASDNDLTEYGTDWSGDIHNYSGVQMIGTFDSGGSTAGEGVIIVEYFKN